jgi:hypothetical protein
MSAWVYDDGGRAQAGYRGGANDCVTRAIAIATGIEYALIYADLNTEAQRERPRAGRSRSSARNGVHKATRRRYLTDIGWEWHPTMAIGSGCQVHLRADELPAGCLIVEVSRHVTAVIDGVIHDTHDPSRDGTRCVYGYWTRQAATSSRHSALPTVALIGNPNRQPPVPAGHAERQLLGSSGPSWASRSPSSQRPR